MSPTARPEEVAAARAYEALHVPALFRPFAPRVARSVRVSRGENVLDVACGTGVLARELRGHVGRDGTVTGVDAAPGMLAVARELAPDLRWEQALADSLPFPDASFDVVTSQFGLMFFPDREAALREMLRVLRPGGRLAVTVWDALERSEAYAEEVALLERIAGPAAADALRAPFVLGDPEALRELLEASGATAIEVATTSGTAEFPSIRSLVEADLRGWLPVMGVNLEDELVERILDEAEQALAAYVRTDGTVHFRAPAHLATAART